MRLLLMILTPLACSCGRLVSKASRLSGFYVFKPCCIALSLVVQRDPVVVPQIFAMLITQDAPHEMM